MTMNLEALAIEASHNFDLSFDIRTDHGIEVAPGFFNLHNDLTGQSKVVLFHPESGYVFKPVWPGDNEYIASNSGRYLGKVVIDDITYKVRLPRFQVFRNVMAQEYVNGHSCRCANAWCEHASLVRRASKCADAHTGNWKIRGDEIVLFDFEGIMA